MVQVDNDLIFKCEFTSSSYRAHAMHNRAIWIGWCWDVILKYSELILHYSGDQKKRRRPKTIENRYDFFSNRY